MATVVTRASVPALLAVALLLTPEAISSSARSLATSTFAGESQRGDAAGSALLVATRVPVKIERPIAGAPITLGVPFAKGALESPDHVRVLDRAGREIPSQVTEVTSWDPIDPSVKWAWVFFFADDGDAYSVEFGSEVRRRTPAARLELVNQARENGLAEITTGPLRVVVRQGEGGFLHSAHLDLDGNGFDDGDLIASAPQARGAFADLLDDAGVDASRAAIRRTFIERGSGPLHAILRVEGEYRYGRADNVAAPFVTRIHAYAGRSYVRVLHTFVYTGTPDKHRPQPGDYPHVATQPDVLIKTDPADRGWTVPEDRLNSLGLALKLELGRAGSAAGRARLRVRTSLDEGTWWAPAGTRSVSHETGGEPFAVWQTGPKPDRLPPVPTSTPAARMDGFAAEARVGSRVLARAARAPGWIDVSDGARGVSIGLKHFVEEYPKALTFDPAGGDLSAFMWSPRGGAMSFARASNDPANESAVENWAQGIAKTSELIVYFHGAGTSDADISRTMQLVQRPPVAHLDPGWYGRTNVYGAFAPRTGHQAELERALDYKFDWMLFNQRWQPWYGMFDHGDMMNLFNGQTWNTFSHGEPAQDYMWWLQFMRTGDARVFDAAVAFSRHTMDVDNTHWPTGPAYLGDSNYPLDYWTSQKQPAGSRFLGVGRRHASQHWMHILSAHVWVQGWMAAYYLAAEHRGLDVARLTADMHLRRLWGEHELTGRRLYLSVWNLTEVWDATKDPKYARELEDRVDRMLRLQRDQADSLVIDRYGYTNVYASHGLFRYLEMTGSAAVRRALIRHARAVRDNPPLNHYMESYLASIHSLVLGYRLTGDASFVEEMQRRLEPLKMDALPRPIDDSWTQSALFDALERASHLPEDPNRFRPPASNRGTAIGPPRRPIWAFGNGLRIFGWTTAYTVPYALAVLEER